jgi:hypothetical protein
MMESFTRREAIIASAVATMGVAAGAIGCSQDRPNYSPIPARHGELQPQPPRYESPIFETPQHQTINPDDLVRKGPLTRSLNEIVRSPDVAYHYADGVEPARRVESDRKGTQAKVRGVVGKPAVHAEPASHAKPVAKRQVAPAVKAPVIGRIKHPASTVKTHAETESPESVLALCERVEGEANKEMKVMQNEVGGEGAPAPEDTVTNEGLDVMARINACLGRVDSQTSALEKLWLMRHKKHTRAMELQEEAKGPKDSAYDRANNVKLRRDRQELQWQRKRIQGVK